LAARTVRCHSSIAIEATLTESTVLEFDGVNFEMPAGTLVDVECTKSMSTGHSAVTISGGFASWECPRCGAVNHVDLGVES
jgi:hypothetical protein